MTKHEYLNLCLTMPINWLIKSANNPSVCMTKTDIRLHWIAIQKKTGKR